MNPIDHPAVLQLLQLSKAPEKPEYRELRLHLATCSQCRGQLETLSSLRQHAGGLRVESNQAVEPDLADQISDLVQGRLQPKAADRLRQKIKQSPASLRAALHYASHDAAMQAEIKTGIQAPVQPVAADSFVEQCKQILNRWLHIQTPVWKLVPVAAVLIAGFTVVMTQQGEPYPGLAPAILSFQDNLRMRFVGQETQPGIGFFAGAQQDSKPYGTVSINLIDRQSLHFSWPAVDDALTYTLKLQVFRSGEKIVLDQLSTQATQASIHLSEPLTRHRYEWVLSGNTANHRSFQTSGGFVVNR